MKIIRVEGVIWSVLSWQGLKMTPLRLLCALGDITFKPQEKLLRRVLPLPYSPNHQLFTCIPLGSFNRSSCDPRIFNETVSIYIEHGQIYIEEEKV